MHSGMLISIDGPSLKLDTVRIEIFWRSFGSSERNPGGEDAGREGAGKQNYCILQYFKEINGIYIALP
jgi:hypothetical protein